MLGIFDAYADPHAVHALVLANLYSEKLWSLSSRVDQELPLGSRLQEYQKILDKYFTHLSPAQVAEIDGLLDLENEAQRLGKDVIDAAMANILATFTLRKELGTLHNIDQTLEYIEAGKFPAYQYLSIDALDHKLRASGQKASRVIGMTSCLDEVALFAALVMTGSVEGLDGIVVLGSASHYTLLCWSGEPSSESFQAWWFYGKNALVKLNDYHEVIRGDYNGNAQQAFAERMSGMDTIIAREGSLRIGSSHSSLGNKRLIEVVDAASHFFGCTPPELSRVLDSVAATQELTEVEQLFVSCLDQHHVHGVQEVINTVALGSGDAAIFARKVIELARC